ncbi:hypothetical protein N9S80_02335 [Flavobacteriaceae bacterium]|nr:hypothetical protein [Flavobacteriaceae bacterium]
MNSQLLKKLQDKSNKLSSKIMDKAVGKMPGANMLKDASKATREYEDLNYHYKFQNDSLVFFMTFNHKHGNLGDVILSIRNISDKDIILDNLDHKKDKNDIYDKSFNLLKTIGLSEINLLEEEEYYNFLLSRKDIMNNYYEYKMRIIFSKKVGFFKGEIRTKRNNMFDNRRPTDELIKKISKVNLVTSMDVNNIILNADTGIMSDALGIGDQVNIEYFIKMIDFNNYFDFASNKSKVLSKDQTSVVDLNLTSVLGTKLNPNVFRDQTGKVVYDFNPYQLIFRGKKIDEFEQETEAPNGKSIPAINFPDLVYTFPEKINLRLREDTSISMTKNPNWNESWREDDSDFAAGKMEYVMQKRVEGKQERKDKKKDKKNRN